MDLGARYLGFDLQHPFVPGASPLSDDLDGVRRLEDAGAPMITLSSLFEEQVVREQLGTFRHTEGHAESFSEARTMMPEPMAWKTGPELYVEHLRRVKAAVRVPVVASLNGTTAGGWLEHALLLQQAGADALELNVYSLATRPERSGGDVEAETVAMVRGLKGLLEIPVAVKLSPFYSSLAHFAKRLTDAGADGLVLFNRFYQPDLDVETLSVDPALRLSTSAELPLRLRWLAILSSQLYCSFALTGGVHEPVDGLKSVMAGAHVVQVVSALLRHGPERLRGLRDGLAAWLVEHEYESLAKARGSMNLARCPDPAAYERANYVQILKSWAGPGVAGH